MSINSTNKWFQESSNISSWNEC